MAIPPQQQQPRSYASDPWEAPGIPKPEHGRGEGGSLEAANRVSLPNAQSTGPPNIPPAHGSADVPFSPHPVSLHPATLEADGARDTDAKASLSKNIGTTVHVANKPESHIKLPSSAPRSANEQAASLLLPTTSAVLTAQSPGGLSGLPVPAGSGDLHKESLSSNELLQNGHREGIHLRGFSAAATSTAGGGGGVGSSAAPTAVGELNGGGSVAPGLHSEAAATARSSVASLEQQLADKDARIARLEAELLAVCCLQFTSNLELPRSTVNVKFLHATCL